MTKNIFLTFDGRNCRLMYLSNKIVFSKFVYDVYNDIFLRMNDRILIELIDEGIL